MTRTKALPIFVLSTGFIAGCETDSSEEAFHPTTQSTHNLEQTTLSDTTVRQRLGRGSSTLTRDSAWGRFKSQNADVVAWSTKDRVDKLRSRKGVERLGTPSREKRTIGGRLEKLWPPPRVVKVDSCAEVSTEQVDCDEDNPMRYEVFEPKQALKERISKFLWEEALGIVDEHPVFSVRSAQVRESSEVRSIRRSTTGFELSVKRHIGGYPVRGGPQRIRFGNDGALRGFNKGFISTSEHRRIEAMTAAAVAPTETIAQGQQQAKLAWSEAESTGKRPERVAGATREYDAARGRLIDIVTLVDATDKGPWRIHIDTETGEVYSQYADDLMYTDATLKRAAYSSGDLTSASTVTSGSIYTRSANELVHDFFYVMNDRRCDNGAITTCPSCAPGSTISSRCSERPLSHCSEAYNTGDDGKIRASRRAERDFDAFTSSYATEGHIYFWARKYMQWQKSALSRLGLLPPSSAHYQKALIVANACKKGSYHSTSEFVRTNKSETDSMSRIFLRNYAVESGSGSDFEYDYVASASVIAHELNHFVMTKYLGVGSSKDCGAGDENRLLHEGALGTVLPHRHWHTYYGIGYSPADTDKLWLSNSSSGRVHVGTSGLMTQGSYPCSGSSYAAGRVLGQALWKLIWSRDYQSNGTQVSLEGVPNSTDFTEIAYEAAMQADGGTLEEYAWEFTDYADQVLGLSNSEVRDWCGMFKRHGLGDEFSGSCDL